MENCNDCGGKVDFLGVCDRCGSTVAFDFSESDLDSFLKGIGEIDGGDDDRTLEGWEA